MNRNAPAPFPPGRTGAATFYPNVIGATVEPGAGRFLDRYSPIPANGKKCEFTGLGHARLYQLLNGPAKDFVRVASLREPGKKRGTRLFHVGDLLAYLDRLAAEQAAEFVDPEPPTSAQKKS
jgi:hypothetical protein